MNWIWFAQQLPDPGAVAEGLTTKGLAYVSGGLVLALCVVVFVLKWSTQGWLKEKDDRRLDAEKRGDEIKSMLETWLGATTATREGMDSIKSMFEKLTKPQ